MPRRGTRMIPQTDLYHYHNSFPVYPVFFAQLLLLMLELKDFSGKWPSWGEQLTVREICHDSSAVKISNDIKIARDFQRQII
jgi:hypothetical protein